MDNKIRTIKRQTRIRRNIQKFSERVRLTVHKSNKYCYVQAIDQSGNVLFGLTDKKLALKGSPTEKAHALGMEFAKVAKEKKVTSFVFDKGRFSYHGCVKAIAEGAREGGLQL